MGDDPVSLPTSPSLHPPPPLPQLEQQLRLAHARIDELELFIGDVTGRGLRIVADDSGGAGSVGDDSVR